MRGTGGLELAPTITLVLQANRLNNFASCNTTYYSKTYQHFFARAAEHMGISNLTGKRVKNVKESAVFDHLLQCNCAINFDHFDVLASDTNSFKKSLLIKRDKPGHLP